MKEVRPAGGVEEGKKGVGGDGTKRMTIWGKLALDTLRDQCRP